MKRPIVPKTYLLVFLLLVISSSISAQVGINTTTPGDGAMLDVNSSDKGILIPRVILIDLNTIAPVTVTNAGEEGLLVYNTNNGIGAGKGFYYWAGSSGPWTPITFKDGDFFKVGTTEPPELVTDDVWRTGKVAIGKTSANYPLEIYSDTDERVAQVTRTGSDNGNNYGLFVVNSNSGKGVHYGMRINISTTDATSANNERHYGTYNQVNGAVGGHNQNVGTYNTTNVGAGEHTGSFNSLIGSENSRNIGTSNFISNTGNGNHSGVVNTLTGPGSGEHVGVFNNINGSSGDNWGFRNEIDKTVSGKTSYGTYNNLFGNEGGVAIAGYFSSKGTRNSYAAIFDQGNVGIGTSTPSEKLEVNGKINAVNINFSGIPTYTSRANAQNDSNLKSGDVYRITNSNSNNFLSIKL